jgi:O-antigen/teichoic acid export membrane protein
MGSLRTLFKNTSSIMISGYFGMAVNFLLVIFIARNLGAEGLGIFTTAATFVFFGSFVTDFGVESVIVRNVSRNKDDLPLYYVNGFFLVLSLAVVSWIVIGVVVYLLDYDAHLRMLIMLSTASLLFGSISVVATSIIKSLERMELISMVSIVSGICYSVAGIVIVAASRSITGLIVLGLVIAILNGMAWFLLVNKILEKAFVWKIQPKVCFSILKQAAPIGLMRTLNVVNNRIDIIMISTMMGSSAVGLYASATKIVNFLLVPSGSLNNAIMPHFSAKESSSMSAVSEMYNEIVRVILLVSFPIATIVTVNASSIIRILFGQPFSDNGSANALSILIWSFFFDVISGPAGTIIIINLEDKLMKIAFLSCALAFLNIALNLFMIPAWGIIGASISTLICSFVRFILLILIAHRAMGAEMKILKLLIRPSLCALLLFFMLQALRGQGVTIAIGVSIFVYIAGLFWLKAITTDDWLRIRSIIIAGAEKLKLMY